MLFSCTAIRLTLELFGGWNITQEAGGLEVEIQTR
jgi:hypothetical protein